MRDLFAGEHLIDDPRHGRVAGTNALRGFVTAQAAWMRDGQITLELIRTTIAPTRSLTEWLATLTVSGTRTELPIAVVGDRASADKVTAIRVYHSCRSSSRTATCGGPYVYGGHEGILAAYGAFYKVGPIHLRHCTVIDDDVACGVEFIADAWGPHPFPSPQAGIGVYERGGSGLLCAARIYDDVDVDLGLLSA